MDTALPVRYAIHIQSASYREGCDIFSCFVCTSLPVIDLSCRLRFHGQ
jgi:hypothetical protein